VPISPSAVIGFGFALLVPQAGLPTPLPRSRATVSNFEYGEIVEVELATLASDIGHYDQKQVRTKGRLERLTVASLDRFHVLTAGNASVLIVPGYGFHSDDMDELEGHQVAVRGVVRLLGSKMDQETQLLQQPRLPPLPAASAELPRVSLTLLAVSRSGDSEQEGQGSSGIAADPILDAGKNVRVVGQFRGGNLFGDLPDASRRDADDWVLKEGERCLWVTGKKPRGRGFSLDPGHEPDTAHWLEVVGRLRIVNGILYLRASKVALAKPPESGGRPR
jgi:hypothetical protein